MNMAIMNQKVQKKAGGGDLKKLKALWDIAKGTRSKAAQIEAGLYHPIGGGVKLSKPVPFMDFKTVEDPSVKMAQRRIISPEALQGGIAMPLVGDRAAAGRILTDVGGKRLTSPVTLEGGPEYMLTHASDDPNVSAAWSSGKDVVSGLSKQASSLGESGRPVYGVNVIGSPINVDFNTMVTDAVLGQFDPSSLTNKAKKEFTKELRNYVPNPKKPHIIPGKNFVGLDDVETMRQQLLDPSNGELRKAFINRMGTAKYRDMGFPDVAEARLATTEPSIVEQPLGMAGFTIAKLDPTGKIIETPVREHGTYPVALGGKYEGSLEILVPYKKFFPSFDLYRRSFGANPSSDYRAFSLSPISQELDQQWLDTVMKSMGKDLPSVVEYKDGGSVKGGNLVDELINEAKSKQEAPVNPFRMPTQKQSQYEKDFRQYLANQQAAREQLPKDIAASALSAPIGYAAQIPLGIPDLASMALPESVTESKFYPSTENVIKHAANVARNIPALSEYADQIERGMEAGQYAALPQAIQSIPAMAKGVAKGATAGSKALANEAAYRIYQAMERGEGPLAGALSSVAPRQLMVYHGTPHRFPPTKKNPLGEFDPAKIGTGEGAQAYGHGLYFAESPDVAKSYQPRDFSYEEGLMKLYKAAENKGDYSAMEILENAMIHKTPEELRGIHGKAGETVIKQIEKIPKTVGGLYKVDLPDEHIAKMLDWDKPLSEQSPSVRAAINKQAAIDAAKYGEGGGMDYYRSDPDSYSGESIYRYLTEQNSGAIPTSEMLREMGIPGIKYLDQASRGASGTGKWRITYEDGESSLFDFKPNDDVLKKMGAIAEPEVTRNFVVFPGSEHLLNIVGREKKGGVIKKAEGGITSDDLIIEENPL